MVIEWYTELIENGKRYRLLEDAWIEGIMVPYKDFVWFHFWLLKRLQKQFVKGCNRADFLNFSEAKVL